MESHSEAVTMSKTTLGFGLYKGIPATSINFSKKDAKKKQKVDLNEIVTFAKNAGLKAVALVGAIKDNPDIRTLAVGLSSIGHKVYSVISSDDDIEPLRPIKNVFFLVKMNIPTEKESKVNHKMFPLLKQGDEIVFVIENEEDLKYTDMFLKTKMLQKPAVTFFVKEALFDTVLSETSGFLFDTRLIPLSA